MANDEQNQDKKPEAPAAAPEAAPAAEAAAPVETLEFDPAAKPEGEDRGQRRGPRSDRGDRGGRRGDRESSDGMYEKVVQINRTAKVVKGGRRFSFSVLGVVGDGKGRVGLGLGKANGVPDAIKKALERARGAMTQVHLTHGRTIPYSVKAKYCGTSILMRPAAPGTGIIAGGPCRAVMEALGVKDVLTKKLGSRNPSNVLQATMACLAQLRPPQEIAKLRGLSLQQLFHGSEGAAPAEAKA